MCSVSIWLGGRRGYGPPTWPGQEEESKPSPKQMLKCNKSSMITVCSNHEASLTLQHERKTTTRTTLAAFLALFCSTWHQQMRGTRTHRRVSAHCSDAQADRHHLGDLPFLLEPHGLLQRNFAEGVHGHFHARGLHAALHGAALQHGGPPASVPPAQLTLVVRPNSPNSLKCSTMKIYGIERSSLLKIRREVQII